MVEPVGGIARYRKAIVAAAAAVLTVITQLLDSGLIGAQWTTYAQLVISVAAVYGVYAVPNARPGPVLTSEMAPKDGNT